MSRASERVQDIVQQAQQAAKKNPITTLSGIVMFSISIATLILVIFIHGKQSKKCASSNKENMTSTPYEQVSTALPLAVAGHRPSPDPTLMQLKLPRWQPYSPDGRSQIPPAYIDFFNNHDKQKYDVVFNWGQESAPIVGIDPVYLQDHGKVINVSHILTIKLKADQMAFWDSKASFGKHLDDYAGYLLNGSLSIQRKL